MAQTVMDKSLVVNNEREIVWQEAAAV